MIYIIAPSHESTGGAESLHQLADSLHKQGNDVAMLYAPHTMEVPKPLQKYHISVVDHIVDSEDNLVIVSETMTNVIHPYKKCKICIWWLSLDFYLSIFPNQYVRSSMANRHLPAFTFPFMYLAMALTKRITLPPPNTYKFKDGGRFFHAYNCEYVRRYLVERGVDENRMTHLCGPLNRIFFEQAAKYEMDRENIILYNPSKGIEFTKKLIAAAQASGLDAQFLPIRNMTSAEITEWMARAKVYIDFGPSPGIERIPREAVTMGCNILTGKRGSFGNEIDVPIPSDLKFEDIDENIPLIIAKIKDMLVNYETYYVYYDEHRKKVRNQLEQFSDDAKRLVDLVQVK